MDGFNDDHGLTDLAKASRKCHSTCKSDLVVSLRPLGIATCAVSFWLAELAHFADVLVHGLAAVTH